MARTASHPTSPWIAFTAGAVVMLLIALLFGAWMGRYDAARVVRFAANATRTMPEIPRPRLPEAPRLPQAPTPMPK